MHLSIWQALSHGPDCLYSLVPWFLESQAVMSLSQLEGLRSFSMLGLQDA